MENDRGKFVVIVAGYKDEMGRFLNSNPGLPERFPKCLHFEDYTAEELKKIFLNFVVEKGMRLGEGVEERVASIMEKLVLHKHHSFANGRTARNLFERVLEKQAERVSAFLGKGEVHQDVLYTVTLEDLEDPSG
jgi:hypothetical protein